MRPARIATDVHELAAETRRLVVAGDLAAARDRYGAVVERLQRRATRLAFGYLRDAAEADEAVQDAFVKAFHHLRSFRDDLSFEVWFMRILVNGCLDRIKARARQQRWIVPFEGDGQDVQHEAVPSTQATPEALLLASERQARLDEAVGRLPDRQRTVVMLSQLDGLSTREVSEITGINESTVRVHLFRALKKLRGLLAAEPAAASVGSRRAE